MAPLAVELERSWGATAEDDLRDLRELDPRRRSEWPVGLEDEKQTRVTLDASRRLGVVQGGENVRVGSLAMSGAGYRISDTPRTAQAHTA
jgi:hypothetical protein